MRRQERDEVAEAARRRLDQLEQELEAAGLVRYAEDAQPPAGKAQPATGQTQPPAEVPRDRPPPELPDPVAVRPAGRHVRGPAPGSPRGLTRRLVGRLVGRLVARLADSLPAPLRGRAGLAPGPAGLVVLLVLSGLVVTTVVLLRADSGSRVAAPRLSGAGPLVVTTPASGASTSGASPSTAPSQGAGTVTVDVAGKVRRPGIAVLPVGSRVVDAIARAGGARGHVDLSGLNLARLLVDGEQIVVGRPARAGGIAASVASGAPAPDGPLVNLNTATAEQLDTLPGVGPVTAQKILSWRAAHGAFSSVDELLEVDGIGEKTLADLAPLVTL